MKEWTGEEHPAFRSAVRQSPREFAEQLHRSDPTIREWEADRTKQTPLVLDQARMNAAVLALLVITPPDLLRRLRARLQADNGPTGGTPDRQG